MTRSFLSRLERVERLVHAGDTEFTMGDGTVAHMSKREVPEALFEAINDVPSRRAFILKNAVAAADGRLHELARAICAGPANPQTDVTQETIQ